MTKKVKTKTEKKDRIEKKTENLKKKSVWMKSVLNICIR